MASTALTARRNGAPVGSFAGASSICLRALIFAEDTLSGSALAAVLRRSASLEVDVLTSTSEVTKRVGKASNVDILLWYATRVEQTEFLPLRQLCSAHGVPLCVLAASLSDEVAESLCGCGDGLAVLLRCDSLTSGALFRTLVQVVSGRTVLGPDVIQDLLARRPTDRGRAFSQLSAEELEVLHLLALGLANREIARRLGRSDKRIDKLVAALLAKLTDGTDEQAMHRRTLAARICLGLAEAPAPRLRS